MTTTAHLAALSTLCIALSALPTAESRAEVTRSGPAGFVIENTATVPTDAAATWSALVDDVGKWWPSDHTWWGRSENLSIDPRAGGCFCEIDGARQAEHMSIGFVDPGRLLRMLGGLGPLQGMGMYGALDWKLEPVDSGTKVTLRYQASVFAPDEIEKFAPVVDKVQAIQLGGLVTYLAR